MSLRHPFVDLSAFPARRTDPDRHWWRLVRAGRASTPWWFSSSGDHRFDLNAHSGRGTCYLAEDLIGALVETVWRDAAPTGDPGVLPQVAASELDRLEAVTVTIDSPRRLADASGRDPATQLHLSFGITDAIGTCDSYQLPQEWAAAWEAHGLDGVSYRLAHGTGLYGCALFGEAGVGTAGAGEQPGSVATHDLRRALSDHGLDVLGAPDPGDLDIVDDASDALRRMRQ